jgi:mono/diheme cytochrome c family protein
VRPATVAAGLLVCAAAAMAAAALAGGGDEQPAATAVRGAQEPAVASDGKAVWVEHGCGSCHTFEAAGAEGQLGPDLGASLEGMPASYVRESIVAPGKVAAALFSTGMMPEDYGARIPERELDLLVEFITAGVPD